MLRRLERIVNSLEVLIFNSLTIGFVKEESETGQKRFPFSRADTSINISAFHLIEDFQRLHIQFKYMLRLF